MKANDWMAGRDHTVSSYRTPNNSQKNIYSLDDSNTINDAYIWIVLIETNGPAEDPITPRCWMDGFLTWIGKDSLPE